mgnify:CR=1 FL=1
MKNKTQPDQKYASLLRDAKSIIKDRLASAENALEAATDVVVRAMEAIETFRGVEGAEKARLVKDALTSSDVLEMLPPKVVDQVKGIVDLDVLMPLMTLICEVAKKQFAINSARDAVSAAASFFQKCCACSGCDEKEKK